AHEVTISVLTNALDGWAGSWSDGIVNIMQAFARHGAPSRRVKSWDGRWWSMWGATDLVPMGDKVIVVGPGLASPFTDASEVTVPGPTAGGVALASGYANQGERVQRVRATSGRITEVWLGSSRLLPAARVAREMERRYGRKRSKRRARS